MAQPFNLTVAAQTLLIGQLLCICIACSGIFSQLLVRECVGKSFPTAQSALNYLLLALVHLPFARRQANLTDIFLRSGWQYAVIACFDVEGNALMVKAYSLTSLASVQILDCVAIPCVLVLSTFFLDARYSMQQYASAVISISGVCLLLLADKDSASGPRPLLGDTLCIAGAVLYAASNVGQEALVKQEGGGAVFLTLLGSFGFGVSAVQSAVLELPTLASISWSSPRVWAYVLGYNCCMFALYTMVPVFLSRTSAMVLNVNLLMADVYSMLASALLSGTEFSWLYLSAFAVMATAVVLSGMEPTNQRGRKQEPANKIGREQEPLLKEVQTLDSAVR